jgi:hypothetical protein
LQIREYPAQPRRVLSRAALSRAALFIATRCSYLFIATWHDGSLQLPFLAHALPYL